MNDREQSFGGAPPPARPPLLPPRAARAPPPGGPPPPPAPPPPPPRPSPRAGGAGAARGGARPPPAAAGPPARELAVALEKLEPFFTPPADFRDVSRGKPLPHALPEEKKREVGLTRDTWKLEVVSDP